MKKTIVIILTVVLCIALAGAAVAVGGSGKIFNADNPTLETTEKATDSENEAPIESQEADSTAKIETEEFETLSAEDKALKAEIAKISDTKVDFRNTKQESIGINTYNMTYKELTNTTGKYPRIVYTSKLENGEVAEFTYSVNRGEIIEARVPTGVFEKTENSITFEQARKIAINIAKQYCDTSVYKITKEEECMQFYEFVFARFISGYESADGVYINLDFNGDVFILTVGTHIFDDKDFTIDEAKLQAEFEKKMAECNPEGNEYTISKQRISVSNGKPIMEYYVRVKRGNYNHGEIIVIPIE